MWKLRGRVWAAALVMLVGWGLPATRETAMAQSVPPDVAQRLTPDCPARYGGGPQQLRPRQATRVEITCRVNNPLTEAVDYTGTMVFAFSDRVRVVGGGAGRGQVTVVGNEIRWGGFQLAPGESGEATASLEVTPTEGDQGVPVVIFTSVRTTARLTSGGFVDVQGGPVTSAVVSGLLRGGFVDAVGGATPAGGAAPAGAAVPRTGTGLSQEVTPHAVFPLVGLLTLALLVLPLMAGLRRRTAPALAVGEHSEARGKTGGEDVVS